MKFLKCGMIVVAVAVAVRAYGQKGPKQQPANRVVGKWRPVTIKGTLHGVVSQPFGPRPDGLLVFDHNLHFVE